MISVATTASCHHVIILLQHYILIVIKVQEVDGEELVGHTTRCVYAFGKLECIDDGLHSGMVCGSHVLAQRKGTGAFTVVCIVATGRHDPPRPANLIKVDIQWQSLAWLPFRVFIIVKGPSTTVPRAWQSQVGQRELGASLQIIRTWRRERLQITGTCLNIMILSPAEEKNNDATIILSFTFQSALWRVDTSAIISEEDQHGLLAMMVVLS